MGASRLIRRIHLYLALFLTPWMLMYAFSTVAMNHRGWFRDLYGGDLVAWESISEEQYRVDLDGNPPRRDVADALLAHLDLQGAHNVRGNLDRGITIHRDDPFDTRRITYTPTDGLLRVERRVSRTPVILESLHRRRGYRHDILTEDLWAFSVDLVIAAMIFWAASGLWMWWEMPVTRRLGAVALSVGLGLYAFFLLTI